MLNNLKFLSIFFGTFALASIGSAAIYETNEFLGFTVWFVIIYFALGTLGWILINNYLKTISIKNLILKAVLGLIVLNVIVFVFSYRFPILALVGIGRGDFWISVILHLTYVISATLALVIDLKNENLTNNQTK